MCAAVIRYTQLWRNAQHNMSRSGEVVRDLMVDERAWHVLLCAREQCPCGVPVDAGRTSLL